jgi:hypothetical protein
MNDELLRGSCLCGTVGYQVSAPFLRFAHCHCSRCRKATGSAHVTNLYVAPDRFRWTTGEAEVVRYDLPTAASFATTFCRRCGSPLPHHTRSGREVVVPAGSLDDEPSIRPTSHIFTDAVPAWSCLDGDLPRHAAYSPEFRR